MSLRPVALLAVALFVLAGCAAKQPEGTLVSAEYAPPITGSITTVYQPFANPNPTSGVPTAGPMTQCGQSNIPGPAQPTTNQVVKQCKGPYTTFEVHAAGLPAASGSGYKLYAAGPSYEFEICTLQAGADASTGSCTANNTKEDMSAKVKEVQLRMDGFTVATVPGAKTANQTLMLAPALGSIGVTGTYKGKHLEVTVTGLPANSTYTGKLYVTDAASPTGFTAKESFAITNGVNSYDSPEHNIVDFAEFHLHVGASALNLFKAKVVPAAK